MRVDEEAGDPLMAEAVAGDFILRPSLEPDSVLEAGRLLMVSFIPPEAVAVILLVTPWLEVSLNLFLVPLLPFPSNLVPLPALLELLSGLLTLETLTDDSGFDVPLEEQANGFEALSDPETGDVDGAEEDDASPVTETFLLSLSITAERDPLVLLGVVEPAVEEPAVTAAAPEVQLELPEEACCFAFDAGEEDIDDEADAPEGKTNVDEDDTGGELLPLEFPEKETFKLEFNMELDESEEALFALSELDEET